jgi:predicted aspartyl protease
MQILKDVEITIEGKTSRLSALFDSGSSFTIIGYERLKELFGEVEVKPLVKPREVALLNGQKIVIDGYVDSQILIDEYLIEDRIYLTKQMVKEVILEGEIRPLPDLIIGAPTLETWGLELNLKEGKITRRGSFVI